MADDSSTVSIVFKGSAQSVEDAIKRVSGQLGSLDRTATEAAAGLHKTASAEAEVEAEAKGLTRGMEVAADAMALMSKESAEATRRLYEVRSLASDMRGAFSSMGSAIVGGAAAFAGVAAIGFMSGAVKEALAGEQAQAKLNAALRGNKDQIEQVNKSAEDGASTWAKYGVTVGNLKGLMAQGLGAGIAPEQILGNAKGISDIAVALHTDMAGAIDAISSGPRGLKALGHALNLNKQDLMTFSLGMNQANTSSKRFAFALQTIEQSRFAGQGDALANTDTGKMLQFQTSMKDLQETLGQGVIPLMGNFASALNGMVQAANSLLAGVGGLSGILSSKWVPIIALSLVGLKGFLGVVNLIEGLFRTKFVSTLMGTRQEIDQGARATADYAAALDSIPPDVTTTAIFDAAAGTAVKEPWIANVLSVPKVAATTAVFDATAAEAGIAAEKAEIATIPATVTTTAGVGVGVLPAIAITAAATITTYAVASGALKPVTDAIGNLTATIGSWAVTAAQPVVTVGGTIGSWTVTAAQPVVAITGNITKWLESPPTVRVIGDIFTWTEAVIPAVRVVGDIYKWSTVAVPTAVNVIGNIVGWATGRGVHAPAVNVTGHVRKWSEATPPAVNVTGHITKWTEAQAQAINVPGTVKVQGQITVNNATANITKVGVPAGTRLFVPAAASINGVDVPHGTTFVMNGKGRITDVVMPTGKDGKPVDYTVPVKAKVQFDTGTLGGFFGTASKPAHTLWYKTALAPGQTVGKDGTLHIKVDQPTQGGGGVGGALLGIGGSLALGIVESVIIGAILRGGTISKLGPAIRDILSKDRGPKDPPGTGSDGGSVDPAVLDAQLKAADAAIPSGGGNQGIPPAFQKAFSTAIMAGVAAIAPATLGAALGDKLGQALKGVDVSGMFKGIDWAGALKAGLIAASFPLIAAAAVGAALLGGLGSIFGATGAEAASGPVKKARAAAQKGFGTIALDMVNGVVGGIKGAAAALASIGKVIITTLMQGIRNALPGPVQGAFDNLTHNAYKPHQGHGGPTDTGRGNGGGWSGGGAGASGGTQPPASLTDALGNIIANSGGSGAGTAAQGGLSSLVAQLAAMNRLSLPAGHGAAQAGGRTVNVAAGAIVINGGTAPAHDIAVEVNKQLVLFVNAL